MKDTPSNTRERLREFDRTAREWKSGECLVVKLSLTKLNNNYLDLIKEEGKPNGILLAPHLKGVDLMTENMNKANK